MQGKYSIRNLVILLAFVTLSLLQAQTARKEAFVDIGSGNTKLIVVTYQDGGQPPAIESKRTAILFKKNMTKDKKFPPELEKQGLDTLIAYADYAKKIGAQMVGGGATSAFRQAEPAYAAKLLGDWSQATGWKLKILSGQEESLAGYYAIRLMMPTLSSGLIGFDMGGGSTQVMREESGNFLLYPAEFGAVNISQFLGKKFGTTRPELAQAIAALQAQFMSDPKLATWKTVCKCTCCQECTGCTSPKCDSKKPTVVAIGGVVFGIGKLLKSGDGMLHEQNLKVLEAQLRTMSAAQIEEQYPSTKPYGAEMWSNTVALLAWMDFLGIGAWKTLDIEMGAGLGGLSYFK